MLDPEEKKRVQENFSSWLEIQDRRKELTDENNAIVEDTASILDVKKASINKFFKILKKKQEDGEDELEELHTMMEEVSN